MLQNINNFLHIPIIKGLFWYSWVAICLLLCPYLLLPLLILFIWDIIGGLFEKESLSHQFFNVRLITDTLNKPILITGCGNGLGRMTAISLANKGWKVYAGCRKDISVEELKNITPNLISVKLDVTNQQEIDYVVERIEKENPDGLFCLINNAGIIHHGPIDWTSIDTFRYIMEVNYFSVITVTKSCLPLLKKYSMKNSTNPRIVQISSASGLGWGLRFFAGYASSKHAMESFSSSLRGELKQWNINVSTISSMIHKTSMANPDTTASSIVSLYQSLPHSIQEEYGQDYLDYFIQIYCGIMEKEAWDPYNVVREIIHAATAITPSIQYFQGFQLFTFGFILNFLPRPIHEYIIACYAGYNNNNLIPKIKKVE
jgi:NAD(P)-dependent dehydrogenase (short-subunit alcohol dehydrogenase family)